MKKSELQQIIKEEIGKIMAEATYNSIAQNFLNTLGTVNNSIKNLNDITVEATPKGNWQVYYKNKPLVIVNGKLLDDITIMKYGLEHSEEE